jgi:hypothetical protein
MLQVYNIRNNQITGSAFIGAVGSDWQFSGAAISAASPAKAISCYAIVCQAG